MPFPNNIPWPISRAARAKYSHMDTGVVVEGIVQRVERDGVIYFAIRDGGFHDHPELEPFLGQPMVIWLNCEADRLELRTYMPQLSFLRVLTEEPRPN